MRIMGLGMAMAAGLGASLVRATQAELETKEYDRTPEPEPKPAENERRFVRFAKSPRDSLPRSMRHSTLAERGESIVIHPKPISKRRARRLRGKQKGN